MIEFDTIGSSKQDSGGTSELDKYLSGNSTNNKIVITPADGKALEFVAPMVAVGNNLVNNINDTDTQLYLKQGDIEQGDNITIQKTATGIKISADINNSSIPTNMVTTDANQTITGYKTFNNSSGILVGNPAGARSNLNSNKLELLFGGSNTLTIEAGETASISGNKNIQLSTRGSNKSTLSIGKDTLTFIKSDDTIIDLLESTGGVTTEKYGIEADYATHYGIIDNPNGIVEYSSTNKDIVVKQGLVLKCAGNGLSKTTIASDISYTITTSSGLITLFYAGGELLECGEVHYSTTEPGDDGIENYQAWFNPSKVTNPNQQWQFRSNDTGNVFRYVSSATPIADFNLSNSGVISINHIGYRVTDDDIFAQLSDIESIQSDIASLLARVEALENK